MSNATADILRQAALLNAQDPRRKGNLLAVPEGWEVIVAGDIHGHRLGLTRVIGYSDVERMPRRVLVLQEIIHGPVDPRSGHDRSVELLVRAARLKIACPQQVAILLGNHDVAQLTGNEILKDGREYCRSFDAGVDFLFAHDAPAVRQAMAEFLMSLPLAVSCANGTFLAHSLPSPRRMSPGILDVLHRPYAPGDLRRGGAVYDWTWGRGHSPEQLDDLARRLGVSFFILGHQPTPMGFDVFAPRGMILASDHQSGCIVHFSTDSPVTAEAVEKLIKPLASLG